MKTKRIGKSALIMSALALVLCVSMLVGTTFAWFTDSVTSANNIIKSGSLDVEMNWADGTKAVPAADSADWKDASEGAIFNYDLWEPGYTEVRHVQISNVGTLALKYQLNILANGEVTDLADVIDVYYVDPAQQVADRTSLTEDMKIGTLTEVLAGMSTSAAGTLLPEESCTVTLALKMQETAGNEYQLKSIGADFSVQLLATQMTYEEDSFDDQYDKDATYFAEVATTAELVEKLTAGESVSLAANLVLDDTAWTGDSTVVISEDVIIDLNGYDLDASESTRRPFELTNGADLTINGGSETVKVGKYGLVYIPDGESNITLNGGNYVGTTDKGSFIKPKGDDAITITLNNVNYTDTSADNWLIDGASYTGSDLTINVYGGTFNVDTGIVSHNGTVTVKDAILNVTQLGFEVGYASAATIENCAITVANGTFSAAAPNACVAASGDGQATVTNCTLTSDQHVLAIYSTGTVNAIVADGCTITHTGSVDEYSIYAPGAGTITVNGTVVA